MVEEDSLEGQTFQVCISSFKYHAMALVSSAKMVDKEMWAQKRTPAF